MSASTSNLSEASTKFDSETPVSTPTKASARGTLQRAIAATNTQDVFLFLVAFRLLNSLSVGTFFQPDEFFQSLEPAWRLAFGENSGAWVTWEWKNQLRSAIHPILFAAVYKIADALARLSRLPPTFYADVLIASPKTLQAVLAAVSDFYTWKLAGRVFGPESPESWSALLLSVFSPWQWFCSTRTFSNGLESTLTIVALDYWPWHWLLDRQEDSDLDEQALRIEEPSDGHTFSEITKLRICLLLAGTACILRPTNILIWIPLAFSLMFRRHDAVWFVPYRKRTDETRNILLNISYPTLRRDNQNESIALMREGSLLGSMVIILTVILDRLFYNTWALPPLKFLLFNVVQSLAVFYGRNDWHYYLSQGLPLLLLTALPFTLVALWRGYFAGSREADSVSFASATLRQMTIICFILPGVLSLISHKEVRFIYPLLPILHVITAPEIIKFFGPAVLKRPPSLSPGLPRALLIKRIFLGVLLFDNAFIAIYTTQIHAPGAINVLHYLREQYITYYVPQTATGADVLDPNNTSNMVMTAGFLMPCHSTPWRSHLVFPSIDAWALTCEPPLNLSQAAKSTYLDEADQFYEDPTLWLRKSMSRNPPRQRGVFTRNARGDLEPHGHRSSRRDWPEYLIFFQQLEPTMDGLLRGSGYEECWRGWNTHWHDDWRRKGDVVVWCIYPERRVLESGKRHGYGISLGRFWNSTLSGISAGVGDMTDSTINGAHMASGAIGDSTKTALRAIRSNLPSFTMNSWPSWSSSASSWSIPFFKSKGSRSGASGWFGGGSLLSSPSFSSSSSSSSFKKVTKDKGTRKKNLWS